jgi:hypothetical protein
VQLVLRGAVADEGVVVTAELTRHVAQGEEGTEDELSVVGRAAGARGGSRNRGGGIATGGRTGI